MRQLPLGVRLQDRALFESFFPGANGQALVAAQALASGSDTLLYLHGIEAAGKSHLLQAICAACPGAAYLPLRTLRELAPEALEGLAGLPLVAIDDPDAIAGEMAWEQHLFSLYNECLAAGTRIAVAARIPAPDLPLVLPDLRSRLAAMPHFALRPLDESQQRSALLARAAVRGIQLPEDALHYLQRRFARDMASLSQILERLDAASLEAKRPLTLPFIRSVLGDPS
ncbi:MAG: DnaA regulatory inactivator Hda [Pseudomonadota bacterium]|nr:DnaA regulatory inactivator Hda [Pseudomonadota bacterium]